MIIVMDPAFIPSDLLAVVQRGEQNHLTPQVIDGESLTVVAMKGDVSRVDPGMFSELPGVSKVELISAPYPSIVRLVGGSTGVYRATQTVQLGPDCVIGAGRPVIIGGPCSIASEEQFEAIAAGLKAVGADGLRGGAFKPRTGPYGFQGLGLPGLEILRRVGQSVGLPTATEATGAFRCEVNGRNRPLTPDDAKRVKASRVKVMEAVIAAADLPWIGARNGQSFDLIQAAAIEAIISGKPLMLKRGPWMSINEYLLALEYIARLGCPVVACLRGVGRHDVFRYQPDTADIQIIKRETIVPVLADPSHMVGRWKDVESVAEQALVAGADGLLIEVSTDRTKEKTDGDQAIDPKTFGRIVRFAHDLQASRVKATV